MVNSDIYNDRSGITNTPYRVSRETARKFMQEVNKNPTHPHKEYVVRDAKTGDRVYFNHK